MKRWPRENNELLRRDAAAGLTEAACALDRGFNPATVRLWAKRLGIVFAPPRRLKPVTPRFEMELARENLTLEIALAKAEPAQPYKNDPDWGGSRQGENSTINLITSI